jgi:outer membrane immunogenic protein
MGDLVDVLRVLRARPVLHRQRLQQQGWTAGAGIEYAFPSNLLGRVEYRYTGLGTVTFVDTVNNSSDLGNKVTISDIRAGLAFKFGGSY